MVKEEALFDGVVLVRAAVDGHAFGMFDMQMPQALGHASHAIRISSPVSPLGVFVEFTPSLLQRRSGLLLTQPQSDPGWPGCALQVKLSGKLQPEGP